MTRQERRAINRANAKLSTGPATAPGLETSKMNAVTHGLTAAKPYLPTEQPSYETFAADQLSRLDPQTPVERELADTIIDATWRIRRIPTLEARLFTDPDSDPHKVIRSLDTLSCHELRLRKLVTKATTELQFLIEFRRKFEQQQGLSATTKQIGFVLQTPAHAPLSTEPKHPIHPVNTPSAPAIGIGIAETQTSSQAA